MIRLLTFGVMALGWMGTGLSAGALAKAGSSAVRQDPPEKIVLDLGGGVKMEFVRIKPGKFSMGSNDGSGNEKPPHDVTISKDFWMQATETTQGQYEAVMGKNPSTLKGADLPVETVTWEDCQDFVKTLNEKVKEQLKERTAGLPTEAQWEYACGAGEKGKWCFGDDETKLGDYAWYEKNSGAKTHPVGQKQANAWGLYDMHGNVWEWCENWYGAYSTGATKDPIGPVKGDARCLRGGCWNYVGIGTRSASRRKVNPAYHNVNGGLRVALR